MQSCGCHLRTFWFGDNQSICQDWKIWLHHASHPKFLQLWALKSSKVENFLLKTGFDMGLLCIWHVQVRVCTGKPTTIVASRIGFCLVEKLVPVSYTLVDILQQIGTVANAISLEYTGTTYLKFYNYGVKYRELDNVLG